MQLIFPLIFVFCWTLSMIPGIRNEEDECFNTPVIPTEQNSVTMKVYYQAMNDHVIKQICENAPKFKHLKTIFLPAAFSKNPITREGREQACAFVYVKDNIFQYACCRLVNNQTTAQCAEETGGNEEQISNCADGNDPNVKPDEILVQHCVESNGIPFLDEDYNLPAVKFNDIPDFCTLQNAKNHFLATVCAMFKRDKRAEDCKG